MDFKNLMSKLQNIQEGGCGTCGKSPCECVSEEMTDECGIMPMGMPGSTGQSDSVSMNVNMNASGAGGIRDMMNILKNIDDVADPQHGADSGGEEPMFGDEFDEEFANSMAGHSGPVTHPVSAVLPTGDDLASKDKEALKVNGGGNPFASKGPMEEGLISQLQNLYTEIKNR